MPENVDIVPKTTMRSDVKRVVVHCRVTEIADDAFRDWSNLAEIVFEPNSRLERIGTHAFVGTALKKFVAPDSLRFIGEGAFAGCRKLKSVTLNEGLRSLGGGRVGAFQDSGVKAAYIPSLLGRLRKETFTGCRSLKKIKIAEGCKIKLEYCLADGEAQSGEEDAGALEQKERQIAELREQLRETEREKTEIEERERTCREQCEQLRAKKQQLEDQMQPSPAPVLLECPADAEQAQTIATLNVQLAEAKDYNNEL